MNDVSSTKASGRGLARLVTDETLAGTTGRYFVIDREEESSKLSHDETLARELWEQSAELVGLAAADPGITPARHG